MAEKTPAANLNFGGGNSPNGSPGQAPISAGNGSGDNQRSFLTSAYPLGAPATPSSKQEIIAELSSGLRFYPDVVMYATDLRLIDPFYRLKPLVLPTMTLKMKIVDSDGPDTDLCFSSDFLGGGKLATISLQAGIETEIDIKKVKMLLLVASIPFTVRLNGGVHSPPQTRFGYFNPQSGINSLKVLAYSNTDLEVYSFTGR